MQYNINTKSWSIDTLTNGVFELYLSDLNTFPEVYDTTIDNTPRQIDLDNLTTIISQIYEPCCQKFKSAIKVLPSFRNYETSFYLGLDTESDHVYGLALDLDIESLGRGPKNIDLFNYIKDNLSYDKLIIQDGNIIHVSYISADSNKFSTYTTSSTGNLLLH